MICETARPLLNPYVDGELDLMRSLEIEEHLRGCPGCAREAATLQALREAVGESARFYTAPPRLAARFSAASSSVARTEHVPHLPLFGWGLIAAAAAVVLLIVGFKDWSLLQTGGANSTTLASEVLADHVRSLMVDHLTDVLSSNQHTVKPWFEGKLDFSPPVADLSAQGFPLTGGRLDFLDQRPVAALVYRRRAHPINLFVWPAPDDEDTAPQTTTSDGYNLVHWTRAGMTYWAVSSLNRGELLEFVGDLKGDLKTPAPSAS